MIVIESWPEAGGSTPAQRRRFTKNVVTIGRAADADFFLDGDQISRGALRVEVTAGGMVLVDASESGSTIEGVHGWGTRPIREGDDIRVGPYRLAVRRET